jgi:predicted metal-dependent phosphoesterase TrpH
VSASSQMLKVELHSHTIDDPVDKIPHSTRDLIDRAVALGFDALAITLHNRQLDLRPWRSYADEHGLVLIPGVEATVGGKHVLLLNFEADAEDVRTFEQLAALKARSSGLVIAPHPYFPAPTCLWRDLDRHARVFDAVERNAMFTRGIDFNVRAERWAHAHGKPIVGNGDVHRLQQLGTTFTLVEAERHPDAICSAIASGRVEVVSEPLPWTTVARVMCSLAVAGRRRGWRETMRAKPASHAFDHDGDALPDADAHGRKTIPASPAPQAVCERYQHPRT